MLLLGVVEVLSWLCASVPRDEERWDFVGVRFQERDVEWDGDLG